MASPDGVDNGGRKSPWSKWLKSLKSCIVFWNRPWPWTTTGSGIQRTPFFLCVQWSKWLLSNWCYDVGDIQFQWFILCCVVLFTCGVLVFWIYVVTTWITYVENQSVQTNVPNIWSEPSCGGEGIFSFFFREVKVPFQVKEKVRINIRTTSVTWKSVHPLEFLLFLEFLAKK